MEKQMTTERHKIITRQNYKETQTKDGMHNDYKEIQRDVK